MAAKAQEALTRRPQEPDTLQGGVNQNHRTHAIRDKINTLLDTFERQKLARPSVVSQYRQAAEADSNLEGLEGFYRWISEKWQGAMERLNRMEARISQAVRQGVAGENDREFLMRALVLTDQHDFIGEVNTIEKMLHEKIKHFERDRKEYDAIANHPLVKNTGFLKMNAHTKLEIPDAKHFLAMTVPERRELLRKAREVMPKAKAYAEKAASAETKGLDGEYASLLYKAQTDEGGKIIGKATAEKFRQGFAVLDAADKRTWIQEFPNQMERYRTLWQDIRSTLHGSDLETMEAKRNSLGWSGLSAEFRNTICRTYDHRLHTLAGQRVISRHTRQAFSADIKRQELPEQKRYLKEINRQMQPYRELRTNIEALQEKNKSAFKKLDALYDSDDHGYTEIHQRYLELSGQAKPESQDPLARQMDGLSGVQRDRVSHNIVWAAELFRKKGNDATVRMVHRLDSMIRTEEESQYDEATYRSSVEKVRRERQKQLNQKVPIPQAPKGAPDAKLYDFNRALRAKRQPLSSAALQAESRAMQQATDSGVHVASCANDAFNMTRVTVGDTERTVVRVGISDSAAIDAFLSQGIRTEGEGRAQVSLMAKEGEIDRMQIKEIRVLRDVLRSSLI